MNNVTYTEIKTVIIGAKSSKDFIYPYKIDKGFFNGYMFEKLNISSKMLWKLEKIKNSTDFKSKFDLSVDYTDFRKKCGHPLIINCLLENCAEINLLKALYNHLKANNELGYVKQFRATRKK